MLRRIKMENMKGTTAIQELTGRDIILGRNGAGKTTRMQAIGLAMNGYVPGKGKTTADTFKMASDDTMKVGLETDTFEMERGFKKTSKLKADGNVDVKISQGLFISPSAGETTNAQKEQRIREELGDFPVMMDFGAFIGMTDNKKRDFIYSLSSSQTVWDKLRIEEELREGAGVDATINPEYAEFCEKNIAETMAQFKDGIDVQAGLLGMSEYAKDQLKYWKKEKANSEGAARKLTELKNKGQQTDRDLALNEEKLKELEARRDELTNQLAELTAKNNVTIDKKRLLEGIEREIEILSEAPDALLIDALEKEVANMQHTIETASEKPFEDRDKELKDAMAELNSRRKDASAKVVEATKNVHAIEAEIKSNADLLKRIEGMNGCCAFSAGLPCNQDFTDFIKQTNDILDDAYDKQDVAEEALRNAQNELQKIAEEAATMEAAKVDNQQALKDYRKSIDNIRKDLESKRAELAKLEAREPALAAKKEMKAVIEAEIAQNPEVDLTAMQEEKTLVSGQIGALRMVVDEQKKFKRDLENIKSNVIDSKTAEYNVLSWKSIVDTIGQSGIKGKMVKEMLDPMKTEIDNKIKAIGLTQSMYFETESDTGREVFTFGFEDTETGQRRPFEALSTGEQLLFMITLMTTMIERADPPVKLLALDNINDLDPHNLALILHGLNEAGQKMDNIILSGVAEPSEEDTAGWKVWRL